MLNPSFRNAGQLSAILGFLALTVGCNEKRQTYAEAAQLYDVEMRELTRLEERRDELLKATQKIEASTAVLNSARDLIGNTAADLNALQEATKGLIDPSLQNKADKTVEENLKKIEELTKVDEQANQQAAEAAAKAKEAAEKELPELEQQIVKQKTRVEAACKAKEALAP